MQSKLDSKTRHYLNLATDSRSLPDLPNKKNKTNWVEKAGGLPKYIERIAKHLHSEKGMDVGRAIATAVNTVKRWCKSGSVTEGGKGRASTVTAKTKAEACAALAEWKAKAASSKVTASVGKPKFVNYEGQLLFPEERDLILSIVAEMEVTGDDEFDYDAFELALESERQERGLNDDGYTEEDEELELSGEPVHGETLVDEQPLDLEKMDVELSQEIDEDAFSESLERARLGLDLSIVHFDPADHPRDPRGRFKELLSGLKEGQQITLPNGKAVKKTKKGYSIRPTNQTDSFMPVSGKVSPEGIATRVGIDKLEPNSMSGPSDDFEKTHAAFEAAGFSRVQIEDSSSTSVTFSLPGGDDEYNDWSLEKASEMPWVVTSAKDDDWVLTQLPHDAYEDDIDDYDAEQLTHHVLGPSFPDALKKAHEALKPHEGVAPDRYGLKKFGGK